MANTFAGMAIAVVVNRMYNNPGIKMSPDEILKTACEPYADVLDVDFDGAQYDGNFRECLIAAIKSGEKYDKTTDPSGKRYYEEVYEPFREKYLNSAHKRCLR